jgi:N-acyl-D-aspartate/D-glutamate deacylase
MFDVVMVGGTLVDGTGAPARVADIGVRDGHVAEIAPPGSLSSPGTRVIDATGLVVAPGFIDIHTHHDAQVFWDPACTPSPLHGVTTVMAGNCGFTIAPLLGESADYLMRMLSRVEGMPLEALQEGVPWNWRTTAEFLDRVAAMSPVMNMGFMVGHSAVRRSVLGSRTLDGAASDAELAIMRSLVADGLAAGGIGFSSSWSATHCDEAGDPVPSRASGPDELVALCEVVADHPGTQLEFSPTNVGFDDRHIETMIRMSAAARRPLNWSIYMPADAQREASLAKVAVADTAVARGARVQPLMYPGVLTVRASFLGAAFDSLPGWSKMLASSHADKLAALGDPLSRAELDRSARSPREDGTMHDSARWADMVVQETFAPQNKVHEGRRIGDIAAEQSRDPFDVLCDMVIADDLRTGVVPHATGSDSASWELRESAWRDPRVLLGASDAGAHLDLISTFDWCTAFLALNRERQVLGLERAVHRITGALAAAYGIRDRGVVAVGAKADIVVFDAAVIAPGPVRWRQDLPGGAGRLYGEGVGIEHVFVNGVEIVAHGALTGAQPGGVLRSGRDTRTVVVG